MFQSQKDESIPVDLLVDAVADSTTDDADSPFNKSGLEDSVFYESDPGTEDDASLSDNDDVLPPPEHYLEIGENTTRDEGLIFHSVVAAAKNGRLMDLF
jgi:hypothetical protein